MGGMGGMGGMEGDWKGWEELGVWVIGGGVR